ncbi:ATP-binding protein [Brevundimonas sp.]|uniref:sensor histidine kinase n=1 Tax=Brevundimonas sp. TaxID=1871086 RepID=UPI0035ADA972
MALATPRVARSERSAWIVLIGAWLASTVAAMWLAGAAAERDSRAELARQAEAAADLHAAVLRSELEKHRSLPVALAGDPDIAHLLAGGGAGETEAINGKLETLATQTRAAVIYVIGADGVTRAASNWRLSTSFVGADYGFRPYFVDGMARGEAEFFALGTVSGRPGLYLSRRVEGSGGQALGVVVVKVEFDALEAEWRASGEPAYVVDPGGVVLITSEPDWRFRTLEPLDDRRRRLTLTDQTLAPEDLRPLPFETPDAAPALIEVAVGGEAQRWMYARTGTATPGWTLHLLAPTRGAIKGAASSARAVAALAVALLAVGAALMLRRRQQQAVRAREDERRREELERRIDERTRELREANQALNAEMEERRRAEASRELLRDELVQAGKLAALGQIVAGVAHEINQPVAAIRTQAEIAETYVGRAEGDKARGALSRISDLTQRIGAITQELRAFSRKSEPGLQSVRMAEAVDGALLLLGGRLREGGVQLVRTGGRDIRVTADRFRLEQVIVNLVQNACQALEGLPDPRIMIAVSRDGESILLSIADNGPGVSSEMRERLFTPFTTSRPAGLGLGLVICRDIVAGFGGELSLADSDEGAVFVVRLKAAP